MNLEHVRALNVRACVCAIGCVRVRDCMRGGGGKEVTRTVARVPPPALRIASHHVSGAVTHFPAATPSFAVLHSQFFLLFF